MMMGTSFNIGEIISIAIEAGDKILEVYQSNFEVESKQDHSPLTLADKRSHEAIVSRLEALYPHIPVVSEEGKAITYEQRMHWEYFWLVDPLDGTKEFVKRNGEFTVNIALIHHGYPVLGVIYAPFLDICYFAKAELGAFKVENVTKINSDNLLNKAIAIPNVKNKTISVVGSRSHMSKETELYITKVKDVYGEVDFTAAGSSLKLCLVAEGRADVYPRFAPTMEWDTAAGQAIVEASGGKVIQAGSGERVQYNKENLLNPFFIAQNKNFAIG